MNLKTRAVLVTAGILFLVLAVNTLVNISVATNKYRDALIGRATAALADGTRKDINKAIGFGIPVERARRHGGQAAGLMEADKDLSER